MSPRLILTGMLPFVVLAAAILAVPISVLLLELYRRAVRRGMERGDGATSFPDRAKRRAPSTPLQLQRLSANRGVGQQGEASPAWLLGVAHGRWRTILICAAAGACYAVVMTAGTLLAWHATTGLISKAILMFWTYCWPIAIGIIQTVAYDSKRRIQVFGVYFGALFIIFLALLIRNPESSIKELGGYWLVTNGPPTVLILAFLFRPIRSVGLLVIAFLIVLISGSEITLLIASNGAVLRTLANAGAAVGLNANTIFSGIILAGMAAFGPLLGWPLLRILGKRYGEKKFSDQSLMLDAVWIVFAAVQSIDLVFEAPFWILTGLAAFAVFKLASHLGYRSAFAGQWKTEPRTLLLLRVFALGKRSEKLFSKLCKHWQYAGNIIMIAGPDLVTATVEPHEFLDFLRGRIGRRFVCGDEDLRLRISALDKIPDHDGRYRIAEFFCHKNTWQYTMEHLAMLSDAVLMDLRSFSAARQGCIYELSRLLDLVDLRRVVFLVDETTDSEFLEKTMQDLWQDLRIDSPNQKVSAPAARLFSPESQDERQLLFLMRQLSCESLQLLAAA